MNLNNLFDFDSCHDPDCGIYWLGCRCHPVRYARIARTGEESICRWTCPQRDAKAASNAATTVPESGSG